MKVVTAEDFVPDEGLDPHFLEETESKMKKAKAFFSQKVAPKQEKQPKHSEQDSDRSVHAIFFFFFSHISKFNLIGDQYPGSINSQF